VLHLRIREKIVGTSSGNDSFVDQVLPYLRIALTIIDDDMSMHMHASSRSLRNTDVVCSSPVP
jgi:hypothetical protein